MEAPLSLAGLSLRDLEYLVAVAECRHFGRAAARCAVSQPALSTQVRKLEGLLGTPVFERVPGAVLLTGQGEAILAHARFVLSAARALLDAARAAGAAPLAGPFRLGALPTLGPYLLPHALRPLRQAYPAMEPVLSEDRTDRLVAGLRAGVLDAALACSAPADANLRATPLFFEPFRLAHPPGEPPRPGQRLGDLPLVLLEDGHCLRDQTLALCGPGPGRAGPGRAATGLEMLRHMVAAGEGCALVPELAARSLGPLPGLMAYSPLPDPAAGREVVLLTRASDPRAPALEAVARLLRGVAAAAGLAPAADPAAPA